MELTDGSLDSFISPQTFTNWLLRQDAFRVFPRCSGVKCPIGTYLNTTYPDYLFTVTSTVTRMVESKDVWDHLNHETKIPEKWLASPAWVHDFVMKFDGDWGEPGMPHNCIAILDEVMGIETVQ